MGENGASATAPTDGFTHTLKHPAKVRGTELKTLTLRRPLVRDLIAAERQPGDVGGTAALLAICAGVSLGDFGYLDAEGYRALAAEAERHGFFGAAAASGD